MNKHYYVNKQNTGNPNYNHEVHAEDCQWLPSVQNCDYLGHFDSCEKAIKKAQEFYTRVDGCATCCPNCHKA